MSSVEALLLILETALPSVLKSKGQSSVVHVQCHRDFTQALNITQCPGHNENLIVKLFSGGEELEFWRELAAVLEDFLFNEVYACVCMSIHSVLCTCFNKPLLSCVLEFSQA